MIAIAVNCFVTDASRKLVFVSIFDPVRSSFSPYPRSNTTRPSFFTSTASPGSSGFATFENISAPRSLPAFCGCAGSPVATKPYHPTTIASLAVRLMPSPRAPQYILAPHSLALLEMPLPCTIGRFRRNVFVLMIRLSRIGKKKKPFYRVVVIEKTRPRDGRVVDAVGTYDPLKKPAEIKLDADRVKHWLSKGAQPSDTVRSFISRSEERRVGKECRSRWSPYH